MTANSRASVSMKPLKEGEVGMICWCVCIYICICICINLYLLMIHILVTSVICQGGEDGEEKNGLAWSGAEV